MYLLTKFYYFKDLMNVFFYKVLANAIKVCNIFYNKTVGVGNLKVCFNRIF